MGWRNLKNDHFLPVDIAPQWKFQEYKLMKEKKDEKHKWIQVIKNF